MFCVWPSAFSSKIITKIPYLTYDAEDPFPLSLILKCKPTDHKQSNALEVLANLYLLLEYRDL